MKRLVVFFLLLLGFATTLAWGQDTPPEEAGPSLTPGHASSGFIAATDDVHTYTIELDADQFIYGVVDQHSVDVVITVYCPEGRLVGVFDRRARGPEPFQFISDSAGTYRITVRPFEAEQGEYVLALKRAEPRAETPEQWVDQLMAAYEAEDGPGGVVAVVRGGEIIFARGYGMANLEYGTRNTPETPYHMASVSKQFTAFAIVMLAERGELSLDDDVRTYIPELHDFGERITLRHLLTHTSGLRDQWNLWVMSGGRMDDVIRQGDLMRLIERQRELNFEPGAEFRYSNSGYTLLAEVVGRVTGEDFGSWMQEHVFDPLGMASTQIYDDHERLVEQRAYSYKYGREGINKAVLSYANAGATSLFTTAEDLARWLRNFHTAEVGGAGVLERLQERGRLARGDTLSYALGIDTGAFRGLHLLHHGGADAGYRTMLTYYPEIDGGVIVLSNLASFNARRMASRVAEAFFGDSMTFEESRSDRTGETGAAAFPRQPDVGQPETAIIDPNEKLTVQSGESWDPTAEELQSYAGRYYSPELETLYTVSVKDGELVAHHRRHGVIRLRPTSREAFVGSEWFLLDVRFERDGAGTATGMRVSNGRVSNLHFDRQDGW